MFDCYIYMYFQLVTVIANSNYVAEYEQISEKSNFSAIFQQKLPELIAV